MATHHPSTSQVSIDSTTKDSHVAPSTSGHGSTAYAATLTAAPQTSDRRDQVRTLAIDGADDEESSIIFSDPSASKLPLYELGTRRPPDAADYGTEVQGLIEDVPSFDALSGQHLYTVRGDRDLKNFTLIPEQPAGNGMTTDANVTLKPKKKLGTYKMEMDSLTGSNEWVWKGSVFSSLELYTKDSRGDKTTYAVFIRTSTRSHSLRLYPTVFASSDSLHSNPSVALIVSSLYPFLAIYRRHLETDFTSERKIGQRSAGAAPSGWDSKFMRELPKNADPLRTVAGVNGAGGEGTTTAAHQGHDLNGHDVEQDDSSASPSPVGRSTPTQGTTAAALSVVNNDSTASVNGKRQDAATRAKSPGRWNPISLLRRERK